MGLMNKRTGNLNTGAILRLETLVPVGPWADTADSPTEVTMESTTLTGPLLYLLITWGVVTPYSCSLASGSLLASHETIRSSDAAEETWPGEQRELVAKIDALSKPLMGTGILQAFCCWSLRMGSTVG